MTEIVQAARGASTSFDEEFVSTGPLEREALITPLDARPSWTNHIEELLRIRVLEDDWDGQDAIAPHTDVVDTAIRFAQDLGRQGMIVSDRVVAGPNGTICFEWHSPVSYIEIEVVSPGVKEGRIVRGRLVEEFSVK